jgi:hypothetical protein
MTEETKLTKPEKGDIKLASAGMQLQNIDDMWRAAQMFVSSGLCPKALDTPQKVIVALQAGAELGFLPWQSLQSLYVVSGRVGLSGSSMVALIRRSKQCEFLDMKMEGQQFEDDYKAIVSSKRLDEPIEHVSDYSVADAKKAKLWSGKDNWEKYPKDMLTWRAVSRHARLFYADVITGFYTEEEIESMGPPTPPIDMATAPGVEGLTKRIEAQTKAKEPEPEPEPEPAPEPEPEKPKDEEPPKRKRGRPKKEKKDVDAERQAPSEQKGPEPAKDEEKPEPQEKVQQWQCNVCHRITEMLDKNGHCPSCFSSVTEIPVK